MVVRLVPIRFGWKLRWDAGFEALCKLLLQLLLKVLSPKASTQSFINVRTMTFTMMMFTKHRSEMVVWVSVFRKEDSIKLDLIHIAKLNSNGTRFFYQKKEFLMPKYVPRSLPGENYVNHDGKEDGGLMMKSMQRRCRFNWCQDIWDATILCLGSW